MRPLAQNLLRLSLKFNGQPQSEPLPPLPRYDEIRAFLQTLDMPDDSARRYFEIHLDRFATSLALVPPPARTGRVLELGAYMQMTPALACVLGYTDVRGAYLGTPGEFSEKVAYAGGKQIFACRFDHFNAELDPYPYADGTFDCVLACEIFEHFLHDPMHMLTESWRILGDNGTLLLTTPNITSATAVARVLEQSGNPQLYSKYASVPGEVGHMREYTPLELQQALDAAGFKIVHLFTKTAPGYTAHQRIVPLLQLLGYPTHLRGEQMFCLAKKSTPGINRHPDFLYD